MPIQTINYQGWKNTIRLHNPAVEAVLTTDVGPRIIALNTPGGENLFKNYQDQMGQSGESTWQIRGGHRIWTAPEDVELSYALDNQPIGFELIGNQGVRIGAEVTSPHRLRKELDLILADDSPKFTVNHRITNLGDESLEVASWGLSVMAAGGTEIIPLPPAGSHPAALLPDRVLVAWPYTDFSDPRWNFGNRFITLRQSPDFGPTKLGLRHTEKWIAYVLREQLFIKTIAFDKTAAYTDFGCNFETFSNQDMLEIESLSPLRCLAPGESIGHTEQWFVAGNIEAPDLADETAVTEWIAPYLSEAGI